MLWYIGVVQVNVNLTAMSRRRYPGLLLLWINYFSFTLQLKPSCLLHPRAKARWWSAQQHAQLYQCKPPVKFTWYLTCSNVKMQEELKYSSRIKLHKGLDKWPALWCKKGGTTKLQCHNWKKLKWLEVWKCKDSEQCFDSSSCRASKWHHSINLARCWCFCCTSPFHIIFLTTNPPSYIHCFLPHSLSLLRNTSCGRMVLIHAQWLNKRGGDAGYDDF